MGFSNFRTQGHLGGREFEYWLRCGHTKVSGIVPPVAEGKPTFCWPCQVLVPVRFREATGRRSTDTQPP